MQNKRFLFGETKKKHEPHLNRDQYYRRTNFQITFKIMIQIVLIKQKSVNLLKKRRENLPFNMVNVQASQEIIFQI